MHELPGLIVRPAVPEDILSLSRVHVQCWREAYAGIIALEFLARMNAEGWAKMWDKTFREGVSDKPEYERHFVAELPRVGIVGFAGCGASRHPQLKYDAELYAIYVLRDYQGSGVGRALTGAAVDFLIRRRFSSMILWVLEKNIRTRRFYESLGGNLVGVKSTFQVGGTDYGEVAYSWENLAGLAGSLEKGG